MRKQTFLPITLIGILFVVALLNGCSSPDWRTASRQPAGIAPLPSENTAAVIEFYAADAFSWRGWFAVHTWVAVKAENASQYTVYEVVGWRVESGLPALRQYKTETPDRYWYGARPEKILSVTGERAEQLIPKIHELTAKYPWANEYKVFPGPNSNTYPAWLGLQIPELELDMPLSAIGSGYADNEE